MNMTVWEWFEQRSYHHRDFAGLAVSSGNGAERPSTTLIFPARNVAGTIGTILSVVADLRARTGLPDQVIVVDADSPDGTADIARAHGAEVYSENELMPGLRPRAGQGRRDVARACRSRAGTSSCSPTRTPPTSRSTSSTGRSARCSRTPASSSSRPPTGGPSSRGGSQIPDGGGRVTELMAKPLINLFYPELAGFVQPLAGEFAARRDLLSKVPFFTGYGVEIGMMIDVFAAGRPRGQWPRSTSAPGRTGTSRWPASPGCPRSCCAPWPRARAWPQRSTATGRGRARPVGAPPAGHLPARRRDRGRPAPRRAPERADRAPAAGPPDRRQRAQPSTRLSR